jgi:hypothetical protein
LIWNAVDRNERKEFSGSFTWQTILQQIWLAITETIHQEQSSNLCFSIARMNHYHMKENEIRHGSFMNQKTEETKDCMPAREPE